MTLPELTNNKKIYASYKESGLDSLDKCYNKDYYINYPHDVVYNYNSRGYRDIEWPNQIDEQVIWCVGDSFTLGLGCPFEYTYPNLLRDYVNRPIINISMDGGSNQYITRKAKYIIENVKPKHLIIHWSYFHRREDPNPNKSDEERRIYEDKTSDANDDCLNILNCIEIIEGTAKLAKSKILHSFVVNASSILYVDYVYETLQQNNYNSIRVAQIDFARDSHHYGVETQKLFAKQIVDSGFLE